jgi:GPH family glycoside/pentoside/hexuronide:cation symporter
VSEPTSTVAAAAATTRHPPAAVTSDRLSLQAIVGYGAFRFVTVLVMGIMAHFVQVYYTIVWQVPPRWILIAFPLLKIMDLMIDPWIGKLSDGTRSRWGRRRPWVLVGGIALAVNFWLFWSPKYVLFWVAHPTTAQIFACYVVFYFLHYLFHSASGIPYNALGAELSTHQDERTRIFTLRHLLGLPAGVLATLTFVVASDVRLFPSEREGMPAVIAVVSLLIVAGSVWTAVSTRERVREHSAAPPVSLRTSLKETLSNRPFRLVCLSSLCFFSAYLFVLQFGSYLMINAIFDGDRSRYSQLNAAATLLLACLSFLLTLLVRRVAVRFDKRRALRLFAAAGLLIPVATLFAFDGERPYLYLLLTISIAAAATSMDVLPFAIIADVADLEEVKTGRRKEGAFMGVYNSIYSLGIMLAPVFTNLFLELSGFDGKLALQTDDTISKFRIAITGFSAAGVVASLAFALLFPLRREDVDRARAELELRAARTAGV